MVGTTGVYLVTVIGAETAEHPPTYVTVTVKVPELTAFTLCVVALFDHK